MGEHRNWYPSYPVEDWTEDYDTERHVFREEKGDPPFKIGAHVSAYSMPRDVPGSSAANYTATASTTQSVFSCASASTKKWRNKFEWSNNKQHKLLQYYKHFKVQLSRPDVDEQTVWRNIAEKVREKTSLNCDGSDCRNKIDELKREYERIKSSTITSYKEEKYLAFLRTVFETTENPVVSNAQMLTQTCAWNKETEQQLLRAYAKYKAEFSSPGVNEQIVWWKIVEEVRKKISLNCDASDCRNKIEEMKCEYERRKNSPLKDTDWKTARYLDYASKFFETNENPATSNIQMLIQRQGWTKAKERKLLQTYAKYKAEFSSPDVNRQTVWWKIADEFTERTSFKCDELECRSKIDDMRCEYERLKNSPIANRKQAKFFDYMKNCFETTENPVNFSVEQSHNVQLKDCIKKDKKYLLSLLQTYAKYKTELNHPDAAEQGVWGKIAREMKEVFSYNCGESLCRSDLLELKNMYESTKNGSRTANLPFYYDEARRAFETAANLEKTFTLRVDNLSNRYTESDLQDIFQYFGRIANIYMSRDEGLFRGTAFITFCRQEDAHRAFLSVNGHMYDNSILRVRWLETWGFKTEKNRKRRMHAKGGYSFQKRGRQDVPDMQHNTFQNQNPGNYYYDDDDDDDISASNQFYEDAEKCFPQPCSSTKKFQPFSYQ